MRAGILILLLLIASMPSIGWSQTLAKKGILDLNNWDPDARPLLTLDGTWRLLPDQLAVPEDVAAWFAKAKPIAVPNGWDRFKARKKNPIRYGTYALQIKNPPQDMEDLGLTAINAFSSYRLYLVQPSGEAWRADILAEQGRVADNPLDAIPFNYSQPVSFHFQGQEFYLVLQVSNFLPLPGGLIASPLFGSAHSVEKYSLLKRHEAFFVLGMLVLIAIFNLGLYIQRPEDRSSLWLACFSFVAGARYVGTEDLLLYLFETPSYKLFAFSYVLRGYVFFIGVAAYIAFFDAIFPKAVPKKLVHASWTYALLYGLFITVVPLEKHLPLWTLFIMPMLVAALYVLSRLGTLAWHRYPGSWLAASALTINALTFFNDLMVYTHRYDFIYLAQYGMVLFTMIQSLIAGQRFAKAARTADNLSRNLQKEVGRQTREIRSMLDNMRQGLFMINADLAVMDHFSKNMEDILDAKKIQGRDAVDLLFENSQVSQEQRSMVRSTLISSVGDLDINFEVNADHLIQEFVAITPKGRRKILAVDWSMICNQDSIVEKILVTVRDVTRLRELEAISAEKQKNLDIIYQIISVEEYIFHDFLDSARYFIEENQRSILLTKTADPAVLRILFTNMHTLKGIARSYRFNQLTEIIHLTEETYSQILKQPEAWNQDRLLDDLKSVAAVLETYIIINRDQLGRKVQRDLISIDRREIHQDVIFLEQIDGQGLDAQARQTLQRVKQHLIGMAFFKPDLLVSEIQLNANTLAKDLGKEKPLVVCDAQDIYLSHEAKTLLRNIFIHLVRNSLDHGIESKPERVQRHKPVEGKIQLVLREQQSHLEVIYRDDGRGLNLRRLQEMAAKQGHPQDALSPQIIAQLIFAEGVSTAEKVTDISGRGIGMGAVKRYLEEHGGRIEILLEAIEGDYAPFAFRLRIPKSLYVAA